jgi:hypothetical protein
MVTTIDGRTFEIQPAALGTCTDIDPSNGNPYEFTAKVPCPLSQAGLSVAIDTTKLSEGRHSIGITLEDAAGNAVNVVGPAARFTVRNARPNGSPAGRTARGRVRTFFAANREREYTTRIGRGVVTRGSCATAGATASAAPRSRSTTTSPGDRACSRPACARAAPAG